MLGSPAVLLQINVDFLSAATGKYLRPVAFRPRLTTGLAFRRFPCEIIFFAEWILVYPLYQIVHFSVHWSTVKLYSETGICRHINWNNRFKKCEFMIENCLMGKNRNS